MKKPTVFLLVSLILLVGLNLLKISISQAQTTNDWPMFRKNSYHSGYSIEENSIKPPLEIKWMEPAVGEPNSPAVANGIVYVEFAGSLYARNAVTGELIWSKGTPAYDHSSVAVAYGMVFDGSGQYPSCTGCGLVAYDAQTGEEKWYISYPMGVRNPNVESGVIYFGSDDWYIRAADAYTGQILWTSPRLNNGIVAVPGVADGRVFVGTWGGNVYALNAQTGQIIWQYYAAGVIFSSPTVDDNKIYVGSGSAFVYALDKDTGTLIWKSAQTTDSVWSSPAVAYGKVYVQDLAGKVYAFDAQNGNTIWSYKTNAIPSSSYSSPAIANDVVYIGSQDKNIYAFDANTGDILWTYETGGIINSSPAIANGVLYVSSNDGYLYAFGSEETQPPTHSNFYSNPNPYPVSHNRTV